jgi:hypothetical protein
MCMILTIAWYMLYHAMIRGKIEHRCKCNPKEKEEGKGKHH